MRLNNQREGAKVERRRGGDGQKAMGSGGDFAYVYVITHEVGHHIQKLTSKTDFVPHQKGRISETEYNRLSVRLELQADFHAGGWAHHDNAGQRIQPENLNHGTSEQRMRWFEKELRTRDLTQGDTFPIPYHQL
ncbi:MAG: neutral zinc metallopeptidase [Akkermansiaceae bacterium]